MAVMNAAQTQAELQRKKNLGIAPTSSANVAQYKQLTPMPSTQGAQKTSASGGFIPPPGGVVPAVNKQATPNMTPGVVPQMNQGANNQSYKTPNVFASSARAGDVNEGTQGVVPKYPTPSVAPGNTQGISAAQAGVGTNQNKGVVPPMPGAGGLQYGTSGDVNRTIMDNVNKVKNDSAFKNSEITRSLGVVSEIQNALKADPNNADLQRRLTDANKYLTKNLGYDGSNIETAATFDTTAGPTFVTPEQVQYIDPNQQSGLPVMDEAAIRAYSQKQIAAKLAELRLSADQSIGSGRTTAERQLQGLQTGFDRERLNITEDRNVANVAFDRNNSPFSGQTEESKFQRDFGRERTDREMSQDHLSRQANVNEDLANLENTINQKYALMQQLAPDEAEAMFQEIKKDERNFELMQRGEYRSDMLANSQLNNTQFNQSLAGYNANRSAFESDRGFNYTAGQDQIQNDAQYGGVYNGQQTAAQQQQAWQNRFNYGSATGNFANGQQTLENQKFKYDQTRDKITDAQDKRDFDERVRTTGIDAAISWANNRISQQNANTSSSSAAWSRDPSNPDNQTKYSYKTDPGFGDDVTWINANPTVALDQLKANAKSFIDKYGYDGYQELLQLATPTKSSTSILDLLK